MIFMKPHMGLANAENLGFCLQRENNKYLTKYCDGALTMRGSCIVTAYIYVGAFIFFSGKVSDTPPPPLLFSERQTAVQAKKPFHLH